MTEPLPDERAITALIHRESRLLDEGRLDDWLALFTKDAHYWVPIDEHADPQVESSIIYDDALRLRARVEQAVREERPAQRPRSQTVHFLSGLEVEHEPGRDEAQAHASFMCCELRAGGDWRQEGLGRKRLYVGRVHFRLRRTPDGWRLTLKQVVLLDRHQPIEGLSFLL